jgi:hypothetical protein
MSFILVFALFLPNGTKIHTYEFGSIEECSTVSHMLKQIKAADYAECYPKEGEYK